MEIIDPYQWLEDQQSPETREWIDAQNKHTGEILDSLSGRHSLEQRLTELMKIDTVEIPIERNGRYFFARREASQEQFVIYVRNGSQGTDQVLVDPHPMSPYRTASVQLLDVSKDGRLLAYGVRKGGEDENSVRFLHVDIRELLSDQLPKGRYSGGVSLQPNKKGLYYARHGEEGSRVRYHAFGTDTEKDTEIFGKGYGPEKWISVDLSEDGRYLLIHIWHGAAGDQTEIYIKDLVRQGPVLPIVNDIPARFHGKIAGDSLFIHTNWKAPRNRILVADLTKPDREHWREIIPEQDSVLELISFAGGKLFANYLENVRSKISIFEANGRYLRDIELPGLGTATGISGRWKSPEAFFFYLIPYPHDHLSVRNQPGQSRGVVSASGSPRHGSFRVETGLV